MKRPAIAALILLVAALALIAAMTISSRLDSAAKPTAARR